MTQRPYAFTSKLWAPSSSHPTRDDPLPLIVTKYTLLLEHGTTNNILTLHGDECFAVEPREDGRKMLRQLRPDLRFMSALGLLLLEHTCAPEDKDQHDYQHNSDNRDNDANLLAVRRLVF